MSADFNDLLDTNLDDVKAPVPLPIGTYSFTVKNYELDKSSQKQTPFVRFLVNPTAAHDDVDEDMLAEVENWQQKNLRATFYLTDAALFMLKNFLEEACGLDVAGKTIKELIPEAVGCDVVGYVTQQEGNNGPYNPDVSNLQAE